jgi:hypothetical protein
MKSTKILKWGLARSRMIVLCIAKRCNPFAYSYLSRFSTPQKPRFHMGDRYLVGGLEHCLFSIIYGIILPIDELIFFNMVKTTNQIYSGPYNGVKKERRMILRTRFLVSPSRSLQYHECIPRTKTWSWNPYVTSQCYKICNIPVSASS